MSASRGRAQCLVVRADAILMVETRLPGRVFWCLPGGGIEPGETPGEAAVRELREECNVSGRIVRPTAVTTHRVEPPEWHYTFLMDIDQQEPTCGSDPEFADDAQIIVSAGWRTLAQLSEKDRAFLWEAGLMSVARFGEEVLSWTGAASDPRGG